MKLNDPVHGEIVINDPDIIDLIGTKTFTRLLNIKQQGNTYFLQPDAIHSRYDHSIGVYELFRRAVQSLTYKNQILLSDHEKKVGLVAALLHDIGHGPYSHCFQNITGQDHGDWSVRIVRENEEIVGILSRIPLLHEDVLNVLEGKAKFPIIEELLFGALSVDQLDFWNRDLHHSLINTSPLNLKTLLSALEIVENKIVINNSGIAEIEKMIKIKESLYKQGFGNPFVVGKDFLLKDIFEEFIQEGIYSNATPLYRVINNDLTGTNIDDYLSLIDQTIEDELRDICTNSKLNSSLRDMVERYFSETKSIPYKIANNKAEVFELKKQNENVSIFEEKIKYSSYAGDIFVCSNNELIDVRFFSDYINEKYTSLPKSIVFFYNEMCLS
ncbi:HD domain-containing protein [Bacillus niameyensis]|uniref:HD domain-containing protein n=1 Tax=Bacillus niameyensis TaxID=1522308 RepID=UPI000783A4E1|nr:HD domain-containing protein [Bacillus niameyensis]